MVNEKLEAQRQTMLHYWLNEINSAQEIHEKHFAQSKETNTAMDFK